MFSASRRSFLGASLATLASGRLLRAQQRQDDAPRIVEDHAFQPSTLFLTWQRDPTTTMTVQWVGTVGETEDTNVYYLPAPPGPPRPTPPPPPGAPPAREKPWPSQATTVKPYPMTDFKVFRTELTGLKPGTDYQ